MNSSETSSNIRSFVMRQFPVARKNKIDDDSQLLESRVIDSLGVLDIVAFLENSFGISVTDDELVPENFGSINRMASFVDHKRNRTQVTAD